MKLAALRSAQLRGVSLKESFAMKPEVITPALLRAGLPPPTRPLVRTRLLQIAALIRGQGAMRCRQWVPAYCCFSAASCWWVRPAARPYYS